MKKYIKLFTVFTLTFVGATSAFAAISDTFTATQTQAYTPEVKASATLEFTGGATDGSHITIGDCVISFDSNAVVDDNDCAGNTAVTATFATAAQLNTFFDSLTNVTDTHNGHGALSVVDVDGTHTQFITAGTETADGHLNISGANGNLSMSTRTAGVVKKPQILTFTPNNVSPEGGVRFGAHVGNAWHFYTTSVANHTVKDIVEALQSDLNGEAGFTCTENDVRIECTATDDQSHGFGAQVADTTPPSVSGNINNAHVDENITGVAVDIPNTITVTDADPDLTYTISGGDDQDKFNINQSTGEISFVNSPNFEDPADADGDNDYHISVSIADSANSKNVYVRIIVDNVVNEDPVFTSSNTVSIPENQISVMQVVAHDDDGDTVTYSLGANIGAPDMSSFHIDSATGVLTFVSAPDYENPTDQNNSFGTGARDNIYVVEVQASDSSHTTTQNLFVTVTDVLETPGHSGKSHSSHSADKVCKDSKATNFSNVGQHDQSLCKYAEEKKEEVKKEVRETVREIVKETKEEVSKKCSVVTETKSLLRFGSKGQAVKDLQQYLNDNGFNAGTVDGIFGKLTKAAVKRMQAALGVTVDGIVGNQTRGAINIQCEKKGDDRLA